MALSSLPLILLPLLLSLSPATAIPTSTITTASEILSDTGFTATSLLLPLLYSPLNLTTLPSATLFTPPDTAFSLSLASGQPPLSLLLLHFSPISLTPDYLLSLPPGTKLFTLSPNQTLTINHDYNHNYLFVNGVQVGLSPVFSDTFLVIYQIAHFFSPDFQSNPTETETVAILPKNYYSECPLVGPASPFVGPSIAMKARGFSSMAAFLELQLQQGQTQGRFGNLTVFAPRDDALKGQIENLDSWVSVFKRHVVPCAVSWEDLVGMRNELYVLPTFLDGFVINVTRSGSSLLLNGEVTVDLPDLYGNRGDGVRVHGVSGVLSVDGEEELAESPDYHGEF